MLNTIDLFVGCGGLSEGFEQSRKYKMIGAVEWGRVKRWRGNPFPSPATSNRESMKLFL